MISSPGYLKPYFGDHSHIWYVRPRMGCSSSSWLASLRFTSDEEHPIHCLPDTVAIGAAGDNVACARVDDPKWGRTGGRSYKATRFGCARMRSLKGA